MRIRKHLKFVKALVVALAALSFAARAEDFRYPATGGTLVSIGGTVSKGSQDSVEDGIRFVPHATFSIDGVTAQEGRTLDGKLALRLGGVQDNTTLRATVGAAGDLEIDLLNAQPEGACLPGLGGSLRLALQAHADGGGLMIEGGGQGGAGPALGLVCQAGRALLMLQGHARAGLILEGRPGGAFGDVEIVPGGKLVAAYRGEEVGARIGAGAEHAFRVISGERVTSLTGEAELFIKRDGYNLEIPWVGVGAEGRLVQIAPADGVEGERAYQGTGWYVGATIKGAFNAL